VQECKNSNSLLGSTPPDTGFNAYLYLSRKDHIHGAKRHIVPEIPWEIQTKIRKCKCELIVFSVLPIGIWA